MIYKAGETISFVGYYTVDGDAKTELEDVIAKVVQIGGGGEVATPDVLEEGFGFYSCTYTPTSDGAYVCRFHTADETVDRKEIAAIAFRGIAGVNDLPTAEQLDTELTDSHGAGSWQSYAVGALLLRLSEDELTALLDSQSKQSLVVFRGDSLTVDITVLDADSNPVDLTDADAEFTARLKENSEYSVITKELDIYDPENGKMKLEFSANDTEIEQGSYPADIQVTFTDGRVKTVWKSVLEIRWDVTR